jgi:hypothetical protein
MSAQTKSQTAILAFFLILGAGLLATLSGQQQNFGGGSGSGTVTHTAGNLTLNCNVVGNGSADLKCSAVTTDDGTTLTSTGSGGILATAGPTSSGANGGAAGVLKLFGSTSGSATCTAPAVAGTSTNAVSCTNNFSFPNVGTAAAPNIQQAANQTGFSMPNGASACTDGGGNFGACDNSGGGLVSSSAGFYSFSSTGLPTGATGTKDTGISRNAANWLSVDSGTRANRAGFVIGANTLFVTSNFTTAANTSLQTITGLTFAAPGTAVNLTFQCHLSYSQATANAAVAFGIQAATNNPTNIFAEGTQQITAGPPATNVTGTLATLATTTATNIVSGTPGATATNYVADLYGTLELTAAANTINFMVSTATSGDAVTVLRGSYCAINP